MSTFLQVQLARLHDFITNNSASEQAILDVAFDVQRAIVEQSDQRTRDSLTQAYAISLLFVLLPSRAKYIADLLTDDVGTTR
jgi:hypothetical protein